MSLYYYFYFSLFKNLSKIGYNNSATLLIYWFIILLLGYISLSFSSSLIILFKSSKFLS